MNKRTTLTIGAVAVLLVLLSVSLVSSGIRGEMALRHSFATDHFGWPLECFRVTTHRGRISHEDHRWAVMGREVHVNWGNTALTLLGAFVMSTVGMLSFRANQAKRRSANQPMHGTAYRRP